MVKIFVVSDTHGKIDKFIQFAKILEKPDLIIHLGDYVDDSFEIERQMNIDTIRVKGNCDFDREGVNEEEILNINGKKIFLTHGNKYNVKYDLFSLSYKAKEEGADVVLFGHTHTPIIEEYDGILFMNPGSPTIPRNMSRKSFGILEIQEKIISKIIEI
ncbi:MAG: Phosphoesterase [Sporanaerobacter sp.]|jgi:uncharacterized protein|uniref:metallophosphoesterase n=1 Tax=Sporanaerobacter sp. TaxID=2010183 RepID=UPI003A10370D